MKKKLIISAAALILATIIVYTAAAICVAVRLHDGNRDLELIVGLPGTRDTVISSLGVNIGEFPAGSHVTATLRVQYRNGNNFIWADEVTGEFDISRDGQSEKLTLSQRGKNS